MNIIEKFELQAGAGGAGAGNFAEVREMVHREGLELQIVSSNPLQFSVAVPVDRVERLSRLLVFMGCRRMYGLRLQTKPAPKDGVLPDDFYASSNIQTYVFLGGGWREVERLRMDGALVIQGNRAICTLMRDVKQGDMVVVGLDGVRIAADQGGWTTASSGAGANFEFMSSGVSSERQVQVTISRISQEMYRIRKQGGRIVFVAGPAIVHTGAMRAFCGLVEKQYVQGLLSGNALATHDIENAMFGTSLGISTKTGTPVPEGHRNHLAAINRVRFHGGIRQAVSAGEIRSGIMHALVTNEVPYVLAGSIRDDGPLPDTQMDLIKAQNMYAEVLRGCDMVIMVSTMLHSIGTGNMLPSSCRLVCVDINPAVVAKLVDRGSTQAVGLVTDAALFLEALDRELVSIARSEIRSVRDPAGGA